MSKIRAVVAEDNQEMLGTAVLALAQEYDVIRAVSNGRAALEAVTQLKPEVAVFDISMPVMNGLEGARRLKQVDGNTKIVFLSNYTDPDIVSAAIEAGALGYVLKPRLRLDLIRAIQLALQGGCFVSPENE
jgi:DNA-binding NarL/FixJ family response regulator